MPRRNDSRPGKGRPGRPTGGRPGPRRQESGDKPFRKNKNKKDEFRPSSPPGTGRPGRKFPAGTGSSPKPRWSDKKTEKSKDQQDEPRFRSPRKGPKGPPRKESAARGGAGIPPKRFSGPRDKDAPRGPSFGKPYRKSYPTRPDRGESRHKRAEKDPTLPKSDKIRLNKFIANSGISSRREADELISMGLISVNGKVITELGYKVDPKDEVRYENRVLRAEKPVYILMNKPKGFLTTTDDPQERKTVMHIIGSAVKERIYPVGRLDRNTTGLLLLTNDGDLADRLMHPSFNIKKIYKVELDRPLTKGDLQTVRDGVRLEEGRAEVDDVAIVSDDGRTVGLELHIGWNRVVRRIFESLGYEVMKLDRTVYAGLDKKELTRGQWRFLSREEIIHLKHFK